MVFTVKEKGLMKQLVCKGFECGGEVGNGITGPVIYTMRGDPRKFSKRELPYIIKMKFKQKGNGELFRRKN